MPSNASYQRLNTEECRTEQCAASRLLIETSDYPSTERERESDEERAGEKLDGLTGGGRQNSRAGRNRERGGKTE